MNVEQSTRIELNDSQKYDLKKFIDLQDRITELKEKTPHDPFGVKLLTRGQFAIHQDLISSGLDIKQIGEAVTSHRSSMIAEARLKSVVLK